MRSVGYSDLFVLSKKDMWDVLKEYPAARVRLEAIAVKRLEKYKKAPLEKGRLLVASRAICHPTCSTIRCGPFICDSAALGRSISTPGLVESKGRISLERMQLPASLNRRNVPPYACDRDTETPASLIKRCHYYARF